MSGYNLLQWSHDLSAMDTMETGVNVTLNQTLQWSHDPPAMDTVGPLLGDAALVAPSMEP